MRPITICSHLALLLVSAAQSRAQTWTQLTPSGSLPVGRVEFVSGYNPTTDRFIVFGGNLAGIAALTNDVWVLTNASAPGSAAWLQLIPNGASGSPPMRQDAAGVYDSVSNRLIIYGGIPNAGFPVYDDLWVLTHADGTGGQPQWIQLTPTSPLPFRLRTGAAYDPNTNRMIVFLGETAGYVANDSNVYVITNANGTEANPPTWTQLAPLGAAPPGRWVNPIAPSYDPATNRLIVFGGTEGKPNDDVTYNDTWVLTNANGLGGTPSWLKLSPTGVIPSPRGGSSGFFDSLNNRLVIFGGTNNAGTFPTLGDTWVLTGANGLASQSTWLQMSTGSIPSRRFHQASYSATLNEMIIFGGQLVGGAPAISESWLLSNANGLTGSQLRLDTSAPSHGGNAGTVSKVQLTGAGFQSGAQITLKGVGPDISGTNTMVVDAGFATTTFLLTGAEPGVRDIVVTNSDGTSATLPGGFTVEQGGVPEISVQIVGRANIRIGSEQTYYLSIANTGSIDAPPGIAFLEVPSTLGFQQMNGSDLFVAGNTSAPDFGIPTPGSAGLGTGSSIASAAIASAASNNQVLMFASAGVPAGGSQLAPVSLTLPSSAPSQFTVTAAWQPSLSAQTFDDYLASIGTPYIPFNSACTSCYAQAVAEVNAISDAQTAYTNWQNAKLDVEVAQATVFASIGKTVAQAVIVDALGLSATGKALLGTLISAADNCASTYLSDSADPSCLADVKVDILAAQTELLAESIHASPLVMELLGDFNGTISVLDSVGSLIDAIGAEKAALGTFQQLLGQYQTARTNYQSCLSQYCGGPPPPPPPPPPPGTTILPVTGVSSLDPNDKEGPAGSQTQRYVSGSTGLVYLISFENQASATAPAQRVVITDPVDPAKFDLSTATLGPITFGGQVVDPAALPLMATGTFSTFADLRQSVNLLVHVTASLNATTGVLTWTLQSIDPSTGQPPTDPLAGFLPPGNGGSVSLSVRGNNSLVTGTVVSNGAVIIFDSNPSIPTPVWVNTIDNTPPISHVSTLPAQSYPSFMVQWSGSDSGSGILDFTNYVSDNGTSFVPWQTNVAQTSGVFLGQPGHTYAFYSIARDFVGNVENAKTTSEASTRIIADTTPPTITANISGTLGTNGWYRSGVTVFWSVADPESGITSSNGCLGTTLTVDTAGVTITCSATNGVGLLNSASVKIKIDKTPPAISGMPTPNCALWPPNRKLVQVATMTATDELSGLAPDSFNVTGSSNEPSSDPKNPEIVITPNGSGGLVVQLQADRLGTGSGRIYTLNATANDLAGNTATATATCAVPHDQGKGN